jgi:hypothetical protein
MKYETRLIWVLTITFGFVFFDRNAANFLMPIIADDLHFNNSQIGLIASALSFTAIACSWAAHTRSHRQSQDVAADHGRAFSRVHLLPDSRFIPDFVCDSPADGPGGGPILPIAQSLVARIHCRQARQQHGRMQNSAATSGPRLLVLGPSPRPTAALAFFSGAGLIMVMLIAKYVRQPDPHRDVIPGAQTPCRPLRRAWVIGRC